MTEPYAPSPELEDFRRLARDFTERRVRPLVDEAERSQDFPRELFKEWGSQDMLGFSTPVDLGGSEGGLSAAAVLVEETARVCSGFATSLIVQLTVVPTVLRLFGTDMQRSELLPALARGDLVGSLAVTEPEAGSDVRALRARARRVEDGFAISGSKLYITNGTLADFYVVAAVVDADLGHRGIGLFIVERSNPGLVDVTKMDKTSVRSSDTAELTFRDAVVPAEALVGGDLNGFVKLMSTFDGERVIHASRALGLSRACFEAANRYAGERRQFGKPIREFQAVAFKLADMAVAIDVSQLLVYRAAARADAALPFSREASVAKLVATENARNIATETMQVHGSYGLTADFPIGRYVADAHLETIGTGTSEIQRMIIARTLEAP
ncbi:acyl-CoA dehydrogenase family protein [Nocardioides halotolerans]|uniref:acyl-CoA dehydrogenase family protein n=1 Tax=Nocardioides halotolerans TaxID=433660 RepID=UPI000411A8DD|nr:acyl-CoA dehydrogenase family protein [Nocardioides halotolerans]